MNSSRPVKPTTVKNLLTDNLFKSLNDDESEGEVKFGNIFRL